MAPQVQEKKRGLTLEKLASYDDVITDALVDKVYYWTTIRKNRGGRFSAARGLHQDEIAEILRKTVIVSRDPAQAVQELLLLPGLRKYVNGLKDEKEKDHFTRHLMRYVRIYMPDCPFEVTTTNRYNLTEHEASITARKKIKPREEIKYLTGVQVAMTKEQEKTLELARKDFSLVISSRKKTRSLFLGPARFANHDCDANARLSTKGYDGMQIVAVKPIDLGEEITVSYGEDYFGDDNEECLCQTCENRMVNGWAPYKKIDVDEDIGDDVEDGEAQMEVKVDAPSIPLLKEETEDQVSTSPPRRSKRKLSDASGEDISRSSPSTAKRQKVEETESEPRGLRSAPTSPERGQPSRYLRGTALRRPCGSSSPNKNTPISSIEVTISSPTSPSRCVSQRVGLLAVTLDEMASSRGTTPHSCTTGGSPKSFNSTDATSIDEDTPIATVSTTGCVDVKPTLGVATVKTENFTAKASLRSALIDTDSELSSLASDYELDDRTRQIKRRKRASTPPAPRTTRSRSQYQQSFMNAISLTPPTQLDPSTDPSLTENPRKPGDYIYSSSLLATKYSRWVECHTCDAFFIQQDAIQTRKECPRCERHSMLYGYVWPKTDREGKHDKEERVMDPRTICRWVDPDEERTIKRSKKCMREKLASRFSATPTSSRSMSIKRSESRGESESSVSTEEEASGRRYGGRRKRGVDVDSSYGSKTKGKRVGRKTM